MKIDIKESKRIPNYLNERETTARNNCNEESKLMKLTRERKHNIHRKPTRLTTDFSEKTLLARRSWSHTLKKLQDKKMSATNTLILQRSPPLMKAESSKVC